MTEREIPVVLASGSPRRRELLDRLGLTAVIRPSEVDESPREQESPSDLARRVARAKAASVATDSSFVVLAADTVVSVGPRVFGKPSHREDARQMLMSLSGRSHMVTTATVLRWLDREVCDLTVARVRFRPLCDEILSWYLDTNEWTDKAGGYALQGKGALLVERIEGNVQGVVGLPLALLPNLFTRAGLKLVRNGERLSLTVC